MLEKYAETIARSILLPTHRFIVQINKQTWIENITRDFLSYQKADIINRKQINRRNENLPSNTIRYLYTGTVLRVRRHLAETNKKKFYYYD